MDNRNIATEALIFIWSNPEPSFEELRSKVLELGIADEQRVMTRDKEDLVHLLHTLALLGDFSQIQTREESKAEKKRVQVQRIIGRAEKKKAFNFLIIE